MTDAQTGLRKTLARKAGVSQLSTEELLAQMTDQQKAGIAASLSLAAGDPPKKASDDEDEDDMETEGDGSKKPKSKKKDDEYMNEKEAAAKAATDRSLAVMASDHFAGREKLAATLLGSSMSADEIITALAAAPKGSSAAADPEAAARDDMKAALKETGNSDIEANDGGAPKQGAAAGVWDKAYSKLGLLQPAA